MVHISNNASQQITNITQNETPTFQVGEELRNLRLNQQTNTLFQTNPVASGITAGLISGLLSATPTLFRNHHLSRNAEQALVQELVHIIPNAFQRCKNQNGINFSQALNDLIQNSPSRPLLQLYFQSPRGRALLNLCNEALQHNWSEQLLIERFVRSQYQGVDSTNIRNTLAAGLSYLTGNHNTNTVSTLRNSFQHFLGNNDAAGSNFAQIMLHTYQLNEISQDLRAYIEREGILSGVAETASFSGIVSGWSGRILSSAVVGLIARGSGSPLIRLGSAILCGAAHSLGQVLFQLSWGTRSLKLEDQIHIIASRAWDIKSSVLVGMFCGGMEFFGSTLLGTGSTFIAQTIRTAINFSVFNVGSEMLGTAVTNRIGIWTGETQEQNDVLAPQTLWGQWLMGAGQEALGDHLGNLPGHAIHIGALGVSAALLNLNLSHTQESSTQNSSPLSSFRISPTLTVGMASSLAVFLESTFANAATNSSVTHSILSSVLGLGIFGTVLELTLGLRGRDSLVNSGNFVQDENNIYLAADSKQTNPILGNIEWSFEEANISLRIPGAVDSVYVLTGPASPKTTNWRVHGAFALFEKQNNGSYIKREGSIPESLLKGKTFILSSRANSTPGVPSVEFEISSQGNTVIHETKSALALRQGYRISKSTNVQHTEWSTYPPVFRHGKSSLYTISDENSIFSLETTESSSPLKCYFCVTAENEIQLLTPTETVEYFYYTQHLLPVGLKPVSPSQFVNETHKYLDAAAISKTIASLDAEAVGKFMTAFLKHPRLKRQSEESETTEIDEELVVPILQALSQNNEFQNQFSFCTSELRQSFKTEDEYLEFLSLLIEHAATHKKHFTALLHTIQNIQTLSPSQKHKLFSTFLKNKNFDLADIQIDLFEALLPLLPEAASVVLTPELFNSERLDFEIWNSLATLDAEERAIVRQHYDWKYLKGLLQKGPLHEDVISIIIQAYPREVLKLLGDEDMTTPPDKVFLSRATEIFRTKLEAGDTNVSLNLQLQYITILQTCLNAIKERETLIKTRNLSPAFAVSLGLNSNTVIADTSYYLGEAKPFRYAFEQINPASFKFLEFLVSRPYENGLSDRNYSYSLRARRFYTQWVND